MLHRILFLSIDYINLCLWYICKRNKLFSLEAVMEQICVSTKESSEQEAKLSKRSGSGIHGRALNTLWRRLNFPTDADAETVEPESISTLKSDFTDRTDAVSVPVSPRRWRPLNALRRLWYSQQAAVYAHNPCAVSYLTNYLNRKDVQQALNVIRKGSSLSVSFAPCSSEIASLYSGNDLRADATKLYSQVATHRHKSVDFQILILSGDTDLVSLQLIP